MSRKQLPTALKVLHGNPGKRPLNEQEPTPDPEIPDPPDGMGEVALAHWNLVAPQLHRMGVLTRIDQTALQIYCELFETWQDAMENIREYGPVVKQGNRVSQSPYMLVAMNAQKEMRQMLVQFGMTPSARSSIKIGDDGGKAKSTTFKSVS